MLYLTSKRIAETQVNPGHHVCRGGLSRSTCACRPTRRVECTKPLPRNGQNTSPTLCETNHRAADQGTRCTATADKLHHNIARTLAVHLAVQDTQSWCAAPRTPEACSEHMASLYGRTRTLFEAHSRDLHTQDTWQRSTGQDAMLHKALSDCERGRRSTLLIPKRLEGAPSRADH